MRGSDKTLKTIEENRCSLRNLLIRMGISNLFIVYMYYRHDRSLGLFLRWSLLEALFLGLLVYITRPVVEKQADGIEKAIGCRSMAEAGLPAAYADTVAFAVVAKGFRSWSLLAAVFFLLLIPFVFCLELAYKPYCRLIKGSNLSNANLREKNK
ncbi:hypothetical protein ECANGB1_1308 [Enterospora canceri]|uniref:Uncharacterized protein n=1 Tax=Enterospora canceri TaxID=1081671 RepID=A0A1Y1S6B6_9MICR|nr:hypothetical protein ECANGB1_1308 [Enterospora canceri]